MLIKRLSGLVAGVFLAGIVCILASACAEQSSVKLLELNRQIVVLETGEEYELKVSILPTECADSAEWSSSDESVVTVESGLLRAAGEGDALITVTAGTKSASCSVTVVDDCVRVDSVESLRAAAEQLEEGDVILLEGGTYKLNRCLTLRDLSQVMFIGEEGVVIEKSDDVWSVSDGDCFSLLALIDCADVRLRNLTISGARSPEETEPAACGIRAVRSTFSLENVTASESEGAGIALVDSSGSLRGVETQDNAGGGVFLGGESGSVLTVQGCKFYEETPVFCFDTDVNSRVEGAGESSVQDGVRIWSFS